MDRQVWKLSGKFMLTTYLLSLLCNCNHRCFRWTHITLRSINIKKKEKYCILLKIIFLTIVLHKLSTSILMNYLYNIIDLYNKLQINLFQNNNIKWLQIQNLVPRFASFSSPWKCMNSTWFFAKLKAIIFQLHK